MKPLGLHRRESIILTAIDVINELGLQSLSLREVANREGISKASIFAHFKSKNELILAVLDHFTQYDGAMEQAIKSKKLESLDAIIYLVETYYTYFENYPAITSISQLFEVLRYEPEFSDKIKNILFLRGDYFRKLIEEAQAANQIRQDIDSQCLSDIIVGSLHYTCLRWRVEGYDFSLKDRTLYMLNSILHLNDSFKTRECEIYGKGTNS